MTEFFDVVGENDNVADRRPAKEIRNTGRRMADVGIVPIKGYIPPIGFKKMEWVSPPP